MRLKAEWERQNAVILAFPHEDSDWKDNLDKNRAPFFKIAQAIGYSQLVYLLVKDIEDAKRYFCSTNNIIFIKMDFNDTWVRDYGVFSIENGDKNLLLDFKFNGWGGKFEAFLDNQVNKKLYSKGFFGRGEFESIDIELEGGAIDTNGANDLLTTKSCILNPNRNSGDLTQKDANKIFERYFGIKRVHWIENSYLEGDDTDGHIDNLARFVSKDTICYLKCEDSSDSHYKQFQEFERELKKLKGEFGKPFNLISFPFTEPIFNSSGNRLPSSYINFLITNRAIVFPTYQSSKDKEAREIFEKLFPNREIIGVPSLSLIEQGGSIHCSTMQVSF